MVEGYLSLHQLHAGYRIPGRLPTRKENASDYFINLFNVQSFSIYKKDNHFKRSVRFFIVSIVIYTSP